MNLCVFPPPCSFLCGSLFPDGHIRGWVPWSGCDARALGRFLTGPGRAIPSSLPGSGGVGVGLGLGWDPGYLPLKIAPGGPEEGARAFSTPNPHPPRARPTPRAERKKPFQRPSFFPSPIMPNPKHVGVEGGDSLGSPIFGAIVPQTTDMHFTCLQAAFSWTLFFYLFCFIAPNFPTLENGVV